MIVQNKNFKIADCLKKIVFGQGLILCLIAGFSCSNNNGSVEDGSKIESDTTKIGEVPEVVPEPEVTEGTVKLDEFGMAYNVPETLSFLQKNNQFVSILTPNGGNAESGEFVVITPTVESGNSFSSQMQESGFEISTDSHNNLTATISNSQTGVAVNSTFVQSPDGGGLLVMYVLKDGVNPAISDEEFQSIVSSVSHYAPTWSLENRVAFYQQQQQLNEQQKLAKIRSDHEKNQLDMLGLQLDGIIGR
jgi:hypothetical protein